MADMIVGGAVAVLLFFVIRNLRRKSKAMKNSECGCG